MDVLDVPEAGSPKSQSHDVGVPVEVSVNVTVSWIAGTRART